MSDAEEGGEKAGKFERFLRRESRSYNEPPENVPREEMWKAIRAARAAGPRRRGNWYGWVGMAATLVLGVAIGRYGPDVRREASGVSGGVKRAANTDTWREAGAVTTDAATQAYTVAATEHLARAEALLTAFGTSKPDVASDAQLAGWARDVLSNTRLLLDSPAARDPVRRRLLEDLELVLVQIVQRSPADGAAEERSHITRTLERTHVLTRLRATRPIGPNSGN